jgi:L,D-transpeptidase ErfK/SrfK
MSGPTGALRLAIATAAALLVTACVFQPGPEHFATGSVDAGPPAPDPAAPRQAPLPTREFTAVAATDEVLGEVQVLFARQENTLVSIAREYDLGYEELRGANSGVDVWLPGEGTPIFLPTMSIIPDAPREGIVLNLPSMRLLYFTADADTAGADGEPLVDVSSHPIGIGREGWATPTGAATVTSKARDPTWYPPASVRAEHAALGDPLPSIVPPGPDNPLGRHALALSMPGYLIHGTNKPAGVGMRVSHGCIRLFPEDIEALFARVGSGTPVYIVDQPVLAGWRGDELYLEVHEPLAEDQRDLLAEAERVVSAALERRGLPSVEPDHAAIERIVAERQGMPLPVLRSGAGDAYGIERYLASARVVENTTPAILGDADAGN